MTDGIRLPTRGITWSDDDECTVPCHICGADVPAEFEEDPDEDGSGGVTTAETTCCYCSEPACSECLNDDGLCAACEAEEQVASAPEYDARNGGRLMSENEVNWITCPGCYGAGRWESECCDGSGGCSCRGQVVQMGTCNVCGGRGEVVEGEYDRRANCNAIAGLHFLGSGSVGTERLFPNRGHFV